MLNKSCLLEFLIADANDMPSASKVLMADRFMISLLKAVKLKRAERSMPRQLENDEARAELEAVSRALSERGVFLDMAILSLMTHVTSDDYQFSTLANILFGKMEHSAQLIAKNRNMPIVTAPLYLELLLLEPTPAIARCMEGKKPDLKGSAQAPQQPQEEKAPNSPQEKKEYLSKLLSGLDKPATEGEKPADGEAPTGGEAEPAPKERGVDRLATLVSTTQEIQTMLLDRVFGQDQAVNAFVSGYFQSQLMKEARAENKKPQATFLFAGPPGVGKTFLAETVAAALKLPFKRFDMSEYASANDVIEFCGADKNYKTPKAGNVTGFVAENPRCVLLFDEIEKAHLSIIHLFLQILDAGRLRDNYENEEISFTDAVIILTTNAGRSLYEDPTLTNLASLPKKKVIKALASDLNPTTKEPLFPAAICSRFASGNVVMFNHLESNNLYKIAKRELESNAKGFERTMEVRVSIDDHVPSAIMFAEGGKADARTVKGRADAFYHEEFYELFRLISSGKTDAKIEDLQQINVTVPVDTLEGEVAALFEYSGEPQVLLFAENKLAAACKRRLKGNVVCHTADNLEAAKEILFQNDIGIVLCDVSCKKKEGANRVLNVEDVASAGQEFLSYVLEKHAIPVYLLQEKEGEITKAEFLSFAKVGVRDVLSVDAGKGVFAEQVLEKYKVAYQQSRMLKLARENKALSYKTAQTVSADKKSATITLFDFRLSLVTDAEDSKNVLTDATKPNMRFDDVIGAKDAKDELKYFVEYLKDPVSFMRKGVRSPKGILLYGPPGTGKTLLAKAMAGESGVTFLRAEGNEFLKKHVGEGPEAVHKFFNAARKYAPSIVFIDEIDAIGKDRAAQSENDAAGDVLTALLTEMDGFNTDTSRPVFVLAATNYGVDASEGKSLDPALLRRFDRSIYVDLPNKGERRAYLEMKLKKHPAVQVSNEQLDNIAMRSTGMSLAELELVFEMALRAAIRSESGVVGDAEFEDAFETFNSGEKREWSKDSLLCTARHEAGHALLCWMSGEKPSYLTIVARGNHGGYMQHANKEDKGSYTKAELLSSICTALAGRACEMVYYGRDGGLSTGASGDLQSATRTAERMICYYGMDEEIGLSCVDLKYAGDAVQQRVRERVNAILGAELQRAIDAISANKCAIDAIVDALMERNHLKEKEIDEIFSKTVKQ